MAEAEAHLRRGLALGDEIAPEAERSRRKAELLTALVTVYTFPRKYGLRELGETSAEAVELCRTALIVSIPNILVWLDTVTSVGPSGKKLRWSWAAYRSAWFSTMASRHPAFSSCSAATSLARRW